MKLLILAMFTLSVFSQDLTTPRYIAYKATTSSTSEKVTIQQVTAGRSNAVRFDRAVVQCTVACVITMSQNGTAATATSLAIIPVNLSPNTRSAAFSGSDVGTGTVLATYNVPAGGIMSLDISQIYLSRNASSSNNFTIGVAGSSGDVKIQINWTEQ